MPLTDSEKYEQGVTLFIGITCAAVYAFLFVSVYINAIVTDQITWDDGSSDVSVSSSLAAMGRNAPFVSVVTVFIALMFLLVCIRQCLIFPVLPFLFCFGSLFFALLPIVTVSFSAPLHFVFTCIFIAAFSIAIALTTRVFGKNQDKPWTAMTVVSILCIFASVMMVGGVMYAQAPNTDDDIPIRVFTVGEFVFGAAFVCWIIIVSLPSASMEKVRSHA